MRNDKNSSKLHDFYNSFVSVSRKELEKILKDKTLEDRSFLESNLNVCIKNYGIVTKLAEKLLDIDENDEMLSKLKIEYKYHNQRHIESAYLDSINYVNRLYHGIAADFIKALKNGNSVESACLAEAEFNYMLESFMSNYSETVNQTYLPVLKIII